MASVLLVCVSGLLLRRLLRGHQALHHAHSIPDDSPNYAPLTIIKPVYSADRYTRDNFISWLEQDYPAPLQIIFSLQDSQDPALKILSGLSQKYDFDLTVNPVKSGFSGKLSNIFHALALAKYSTLVFSDSDIKGSPQVCRQINALLQKDYDFVSCLTVHSKALNIWAKIYAHFWNYEQISFFCYEILKSGNSLLGGTFATTQNTLANLGGIESFKNAIAEDLAMGQKAYQKNYRIGLGPTIESPVENISFIDLMQKFKRAALLGNYSKLNHQLEHFIMFLYLPCLFAGLLARKKKWLHLGFSLLGVRVGIASIWNQVTQIKQGIFTEVLLSDLLFVSSYIQAHFNPKLSWGNQKYKVKNGSLITMKKLDPVLKYQD